MISTNLGPQTVSFFINLHQKLHKLWKYQKWTFLANFYDPFLVSKYPWSFMIIMIFIYLIFWYLWFLASDLVLSPGFKKKLKYWGCIFLDLLRSILSGTKNATSLFFNKTLLKDLFKKIFFQNQLKNTYHCMRFVKKIKLY